MISQILEEYSTQQTELTIWVNQHGIIQKFSQSKIGAVDEIFFEIIHPHNNRTYTYPINTIVVMHRETT